MYRIYSALNISVSIAFVVWLTEQISAHVIVVVCLNLVKHKFSTKTFLAYVCERFQSVVLKQNRSM